MLSRQSAVKSCEPRAKRPMTCQPISVSSKASVLSAKTLLQGQPPNTNKSTSVPQGRILNHRHSVTSQFLKSINDQRRSVQLPAAVTRPQSACDRRKSYQMQLMARQKATNQISHSPDQIKSCHSQLNSKKKAAVKISQCQSRFDHRKSYQAVLALRQKSSVAVGKKTTPRCSTTAVAQNSKLIETSSSKLATNHRMSTPSSCRRTTTTMTPSLSCIPHRKTVAFVTPASRKSIPHLHRNQTVRKEMSMR